MVTKYYRLRRKMSLFGNKKDENNIKNNKDLNQVKDK